MKSVCEEIKKVNIASESMTSFACVSFGEMATLTRSRFWIITEFEHSGKLLMSRKKRRGVWGWNVHPGEILQEEFLKPLGISVYELAKQVHLTRSRVNDIVRKRRDYRRYRLAFGQVFWHHRGILDEPASYL